jgi:hypothetical protein
MGRRTTWWRAALAMVLGLALAGVALVAPVVRPARAAAATPAPGAITLRVTSARSVGAGPGFVHKGDPITTYKWLINEDDTGDPGTSANQLTGRCLPYQADGVTPNADPNYADSCPWPSVRKTAGQAPIVAQGDQSTLNLGTELANLPSDKKYLISVTADGFKIDGQHFTPVAGGTMQVKVTMQPTPLPLSNLRITVFNDSNPVDATYEVDAEKGLAGFTAHLTDVLGTVSVDYYGNPLCTKYRRVVNGVVVNVTGDVPGQGNYDSPIAFDAGKPVVDPTSVGSCVSDSTGLIFIPNMGPNRMAATVTPPVPAPGEPQWVQTTTLEGGHDHDIWSQEGSTGFDTEQTKGTELVPSVQFGFVKAQPLAAAAGGTGEVKGVAVAALTYIGGQNGQVGVQTNLAGAKYGGPIASPWIALSDLNAGDRVVYVGQGGADGTFDVKGVADGTYQLSIWDDRQDYILWSFNVDVKNGGLTDVGNKAIVAWFTHMHGHVFIDSNGNGKRDPGEQGVPSFGLTIRERDNSLMDQATNAIKTDDSGAYDIAETYPMGKFLVMEAFNTRYQTTGVTYQGENDPKPTTKLGSGVDLSFLPIIGIGATVDWGVKPYAPGTNGGIVGTVTYDTTRNELDAAASATESYQPGIPNVPVHIYLPVACTVTDPAAVANECREGRAIVPLQVPDPNNAGAMVKNPAADRGALVKGTEVQDAYTSETYSQPRGCTARQYDGTPLTDQQALPPSGEAANKLCVEAPMLGVAMGPSDNTQGAFGTTVNGNYGFSTSKVELYPAGDPQNVSGGPIGTPLGTDANGQPVQEALRPGDYIVSVEIPNNPVGGGKMYKATSESDVNIFDGDTYLPQTNFPPATPAIAGSPPAGDQPTPTQPTSQQAGIVSECAGALSTVHVTNPAFLAGGGSPFEGQDKPSCTDKVVTVRAGQSTAPNFNLFTDVPIPTHFWGLTLNDLGISLDKRSANYGEAQGMANVPVGLYDSFNQLKYTTHTDFNGLYEALVPSTDTYNCPVPAGPCPNMYRFVGNDPGQPGALNPDYDPRYRTIATNFQAWPGQYTVTDEAPTQVAATVLTPDTTVSNSTRCDLGAAAPQLFSVDKPYVRQPAVTTPAAARPIVTVNGVGFGAGGTLSLNGLAVPTSTWTDTQVTFPVPATLPTGPLGAQQTVLGAQSLTVKRADTGLSTYNALTLQVLRTSAANPGANVNNPRLFEVGPGKQFATVQAAIEAARPTADNPYLLVVVWPGAQTTDTPRGEYTENVIVHHRLRLQGVGPGGFQGSTFVPGSIIDGLGFNPDNPSGTAWITLLNGLTYSGARAVPDAATVTVLDAPRETTAGYDPVIDGFTITGGEQANVGTNVNAVTGGIKTPYGAAGALVTQGGGVYVHHGVARLRVTDNVILGNGGSYGGGVRVGTPYTGNNANTGFVLSRNQIRDNGGTNLAGGVGIFAGANGYSVDHNAICGNHSSEYGGAISAFGYNAQGGSIDHNRIWFNQSYDEGGGIMVAGELPADPTQLSEGSGPVKIDANVIQANLANDDGGGIRLLQTSGSHITRSNPETISITNDTIANNVSAHEGGGIALDDSAFVNIVNTTVTKNLTTATAVTSDGLPAPAGLSTAANSDPLQARLCGFGGTGGVVRLCATKNSKPTVLNDVFSDNRAGTFDGGTVTGITAADASWWDMGASDGSGTIDPVSSVLQAGDSSSVYGADATGNVAVADPVPSTLFAKTYDVSVNVLGLRTYPAFRQAVIIAELLPPTLMGDYHLAGTGSAAYGAGRASTVVNWGTFSPTRANPNRWLGWSYTVTAPTPDIDGDPRPGRLGRHDAGSDQLVP